MYSALHFGVLLMFMLERFWFSALFPHGFNPPMLASGWFICLIICEDILIILKLMIYGIHINSSTFYSVEHKIVVPHEMNDAVSVLFKLGVDAKF